MSSENNIDSSCLVARAVPCALPSKQITILDFNEPKKGSKDADSLVNSFLKLSINSANLAATIKASRDSDPADFLTLQSLRSSALAHKTNTTTKFGRNGANLFADLLANDDEQVQVVEKEQEDSKVETEQSEVTEGTENDTKEEGSELLPRGPVRAARNNINYHPYAGINPYPNSNESYDIYTNQPYPPAMQTQYEYGKWRNNRELLSSSSTPDTVTSDLGYSSSSTSPHQQQCTSSAYNNCVPVKDDGELPDALSDFILKYSRSYQGSNVQEGGIIGSKSGRPSPVDSNLCGSPLSAGSAPESSPSAPHGGMSGPSTPLSEYRGCNKMGPLRSQLPSGQYTAYLGRQNGGQVEQHPRPAKEVLRKLISTEEMDDSWAWISKCLQNYPGALCYQDNDKDTLLHIVTCHMDLGKIYALVEQMLKTEYQGHEKPFDMKNRSNETPLFLAVEKRNNDIVDYLLEVGADPNCQSSTKYDGPLHLAARLGLPNIVKTICSYNSTNLNATNARGHTPLLVAVMSHGLYDEDEEYIINNTQTIQYLLKFGADPLIVDSTTGQTAIHYAIERMAPEIIDVFKENLDEEVMIQLVNKPDNNNETALSVLQALTSIDESIKFKLCLSLIMSGANNSGIPSS